MKRFNHLTAMAAAAACASTFALVGTANAQSSCPDNFNVVDTNNDGMIDWPEAQVAIEGDFDAIDFNDDGDISASEWNECQTTVMESGAPEMTEETFTAADADQSGDVSPREASEYAMQSGAYDDDKAEAAARVSGMTFAMADADGDGTVTLEEWNAQTEAYNVETAMGRLDENGDGTVTKEEFVAFRTGNYEEVRAAEGADPDVWYYYYVVQ